MIPCNPETVSTDYDTSDDFIAKPLTAEEVLAILDKSASRVLKVRDSAIRPAEAAKIAHVIAQSGAPILGNSAIRSIATKIATVFKRPARQSSA